MLIHPIYSRYENPEDAETACEKIEYVTVAGAKLTVQIAAGDRKGTYAGLLGYGDGYATNLCALMQLV